MTRRMQKRGAQIILGWLAFFLLLAVASCAAQPAHAQSAPAIPRAALEHRAALKRNAQMVWGLGAPTATFAAQIHQESRWRPGARSPVGAQGLAQFMPATARWIGGMDAGLASRDAFNPVWSLRALVVYDRWLWQRIKADDGCERMAFTLSAYNGGLGWVYRRQARSKAPGVCFGAACDINPGIHPANQRENAHYPAVILRTYEPLYARSVGWGPGACS